MYGSGTYTQYVALERACLKLRYKPGWFFEVFGSDLGCGVNIHAHDVPDAYHPGKLTDVHQASVIPEYFLFERDSHLNEDRFLQWIKSKIREVEFHEVDEFLMWEGQRLVDPHSNLSEGSTPSLLPPPHSKPLSGLHEAD